MRITPVLVLQGVKRRRILGGGPLLALVVLALACGVVAMHSMGAGHIPASTSAEHSVLHSGDPRPDGCGSCSADPGEGAGPAGDARDHSSTASLCLAVLPLLGLILLVRRTRWSSLVRLRLAAGIPAGERSQLRAWARHSSPRPPTLSRLCISRT